jgi:hypothetical protein
MNAEFLAETGRQIASLSAFLDGFAATFLGILLQSPNRRRHVGWAAGAAAVASASFILAVISGTTLALVMHPGAPPEIAKPTFLPQVRILMLRVYCQYARPVQHWARRFHLSRGSGTFEHHEVIVDGHIVWAEVVPR